MPFPGLWPSLGQPGWLDTSPPTILHHDGKSHLVPSTVFCGGNGMNAELKIGRPRGKHVCTLVVYVMYSLSAILLQESLTVWPPEPGPTPMTQG